MVRGFLILCAGVCSVAQAAVGDLTVAPTRVVFEERDRSSQISLINRGSDVATYRIEFIQYRMDEHGQLQEISEPNEREKFADDLVRFSPRQVTLQPNQAQTVRLLLRKPRDLPAGEYRSHLMFYALPPENVGTDVEAASKAEDDTFSIAITPVFRVSIPVIVRHGDLPAQFNISEVTLNNAATDNAEPAGAGLPTLSLRIDRAGHRSVYGDLGVHYVHPDYPEPVLLNLYKDFVLYTSNNTRHLDLDLHVPEGVHLQGGEIKIDFQASEKGIPKALATYTLKLP